MTLYELLGYFLIALFCFYSFRNHRLVAHEEQGACRDLIIKSNRKYCGRFHVNRVGSHLLQVILEFFIVFPYTAVRSIDGSGPVIYLVVTNGSRYGFLQGEGG